MAEYYVATTGDDSTGDGSIGDPWATPGYAAGQISSGDTVWVKSGNYPLTTTTVRVSGGVPQVSVGSIWMGYDSTPGDFAAKPVITMGSVTGTVTVWSAASVSDRITIIGMAVNGSGSSNCTGFAVNNRYWKADLCDAINCNTGFNATVSTVNRCRALTCVKGFVNTNANFCLAKGCTTSGFSSEITSGVPSWSGCIADSCALGYTTTAQNAYTATEAIAYNSTSHGFDGGNSIVADSCIAANNGGYGFNGITSGTPGTLLFNCADRSNTSGRVNASVARDINPITLTANPFTDAANGDFSLNNDAGGGAVLRAANFAFPGVDTTVYPFNTWAAPVSGGGSANRAGIRVPSFAIGPGA